MIFSETRLPGAFVVDLEPLADDRGYFARTFCQREFEAHGLTPLIAQANLSLNHRRGTIRGLHFQYPPNGETKLVRCSRGAILDVIVDLRPESRCYLQHVAIELTASSHRGLYVPARCAHGYQVLEDATEVTYQMGEFYAPEAAAGLRYSDPRLGIAWPLPVVAVSERDRSWPLLADVEPRVRDRMAVARAVPAT
jgi:dTDP-4-dehydrorhamnose 3,5-epimerase